jgi:hypothetical protein
MGHSSNCTNQSAFPTPRRVEPDIYGSLVNSHRGLFIAYLIGAAVMMSGGLVEVVLDVAAERRSLEDIAPPLSVIGHPGGQVAGGARTGFSQIAPRGVV